MDRFFRVCEIVAQRLLLQGGSEKEGGPPFCSTKIKNTGTSGHSGLGRNSGAFILVPSAK